MKASAVVSLVLLFASAAHGAQDQAPALPSSPPDTTAADAAPVQAGVDSVKPDAEPLPANAPKQPYELAAWCYGAMDQYLFIYSEIIPELRDIDRRFGSSVKNEAQPYAQDMAAAREELKVLSGAVQAAEKASAQVIAPQGVLSVTHGRAIWGPAETHSRRELAQAWLSWALPDRCDSNARELTSSSNLLGRVLKYNGPSATDAPPAPLTVPDDQPAKPDTPAADGAPATSPAPADGAPVTTSPHR